MQIHEVRTMEGNSGCTIKLFKTEKTSFVRKYSSCPEYNARLEEQCRKQNFYRTTAGVSAPAVHKWGYENGLFYFDMDYVHGHTLAEIIPIMKNYDVSPFITLLFKMLHWRQKGKRSDTAMIFQGKIHSLEYQLSGKVPEKVFDKLKHFDWSIVSSTQCHGDLALDNVILNDDGKLCLIDFLDSFFDSWMIDVAKLLQDMELHWSFRNKKLSDESISILESTKEMILNRIGSMEGGQAKINAIYHILLLNVVRLWPYAHLHNSEPWLVPATEKAYQLAQKM